MNSLCFLVLFNFIRISLGFSDLNLSNYPCYRTRQHHTRHARIVGGKNAAKGESPYMAAITRSGGNVFCGASIISEKFLLTASHCICNNQNKVLKPTQLKVYISVNRVSEINNAVDVDSNGPKEAFVEEIIKHPEYKCGAKSDNDIAILKLKKSIDFNENIHGLCLTTEASKISLMAIVDGYGFNNENFSVAEKPDILQKAELPLWENEDCQGSYAKLGKSFMRVTNKQICAGGRDGVDSCFSDSGGPLIDIETGALIGIVSNGVGCGRKGFPGIYTRVSKFTEWIQETVNVP